MVPPKMRWSGRRTASRFDDGALIATLGADAASYDDTSADLETYGYQVKGL